MRQLLSNFGITFFILAIIFPSDFDANNSVDFSSYNFDNKEEKFKALERKINSFREEESDQAIVYLNKGLELARQEGNKKWEAEFLLTSSLIYSDLGSLKKSNQQLELAITIFLEQKDPVGVAKAWSYLGTNCQKKNELDKSLDYQGKAAVVFESAQDHLQLFGAINSIGNIYRLKGEYPEALRYYEQAISVCETNNLMHEAFPAQGNKAFVLHKTGKPVEAMQMYFDILKQIQGKERIFHIGLTCQHIADLLEETQLLDEAKLYYNKALDAYSNILDEEFLSTANIGLGEIALKQGKLESANFYFEKSLALKQNSEVKTIGLSLYHLGQLHLKQNEYSEALSFFNQSLSSYKEYNDQKGINMIEIMLGASYIKTNNLEQAEIHLLKACSTEEKAGRIRDLEIVYKNLVELYQKKGKYQDALAYQKKLDIVEDSLYNITKLQKINQLLMKEVLIDKELMLDSLRYSVTQMQDQNSYLEKLFPKMVRRQYLIVFLFSSILVLLIWWMFKIRMKQKEALTRVTQSEKTQQELDELIQSKNKDINSLSVKLLQKNQTLKKLKNLLETQGSPSLSKSELSKFLKSMQTDESLQQDWEYFHSMFNKAFPDLFARLSNTYSDLSKNDLRLCGLIRSNLSPIEIAEILGISLESVHSARYRLRKKLKLQRKDDLDLFIRNA